MTEPSSTDPTNPYVGRGLLLQPHEYDLVSMGLTMLAEQALEKGQRDVRNQVVKFMVRLKQIQHAGEGMTPETAERFGKRIAKAMESGNPDAISRGVADLLAASLRLDADPAEKIGEMLAELVRSSVAYTARMRCTEWFNQIVLTIDEAVADWDNEGWPKSQDVASWIADVVRRGSENLHAGHEPFAEAPEDPEAS